MAVESRIVLVDDAPIHVLEANAHGETLRIPPWTIHLHT
jgi:hypothetical protein